MRGEKRSCLGPINKKGEKGYPSFSPLTSYFRQPYAVKLLPHPQPPVALGLLKVKPDPCIEVT